MAASTRSGAVELSRRLWIIGLNVAAMAALVLVVIRTARVIGWILIATLFALALEPLVGWLQRHRVRRGLAVTLVVLLALGLLALLGARLVPLLVEQGRSLVSAVPDYLERLRQSQTFQSLDDRFDVVERSQAFASRMLDRGGGAGVLGVLSGLFTGLAALVTISVLTVFMLLFGPRLVAQTMRWVEPTRRQTAWELAGRIRSSVGGYMLGLLIIGSIAGVLTSLTLAILQVPYFLALGLLVAVLSLVPIIGATIGITLAALTALATRGWVPALVVVALLVIYQQIEGQLLEPLVQRKTIKLDPLVIAVALMIGTSLAGILGTLLALPVTGTLMILGRELLERRQRRWVREQIEPPPLVPPPDEEPPVLHH